MIQPELFMINKLIGIKLFIDNAPDRHQETSFYDDIKLLV